jgi:hypothetical protein
MAHVAPHPALSSAVGDAFRSSSAGTVLHAPTSFWRKVFPAALKDAPPKQAYNVVHQFISSTFLEHAVSKSDFSP